jgi:putative membrane protein
MKHHAVTLLSATALIALSACGTKTETRNAEVANVAASDVPIAGEPLIAPAQIFSNTAASSDAFEIATSKLALETSKSASIKAFAQKMITAHEQSSAKLKTVAASASPTILPDPTLNAEQEAKIAALRAKTGADFDIAYASEQSAAHQMMLDALRVYSQSGDVPQLKAFATELLPVVTAHLNMARSLKP